MKKRIFAMLMVLVLVFSAVPAVSAAALTTGDSDGDGKITAADARFTLRCSVKLETPDAQQKKVLDVNKDGVLSAADARSVLRRSVGLSDPTYLSLSLAGEPDMLDPALNSDVDSMTMCAHLFSGLAKWAPDKDGRPVIVADCAEELVEGVTNKDGTVTYTYKLRDGLRWSDGKALTAHDFVFAWNRAASPKFQADYSYMFDVIKGFNEVWELRFTGEYDEYGYPVYDSVDPDARLSVEAPDDKTLVVTLYNYVPYWNELLAFQTYYPVREDVVSNRDWAKEPETYVNNGPYTITDWKHDICITLTKNENYIDADKVTMPELEFYLSDNADEILTNYKNGRWLFIDTVPEHKITEMLKDYPDEFVRTGVCGTYYSCWNITKEILPADSNLTGDEAEKARAEIRNAVNLLFDRNAIVDGFLMGGSVAASSFVAMGITNPDGTQFYKTANSTEDAFDGYFDTSASAYQDNCNAAVKTLKKYYKFNEATGKFTNFPEITYTFNESSGHRIIAEYLAASLAKFGIPTYLVELEWNTFLDVRKNGQYLIARNGWIADYNDPICFLDMWTTDSGNNDAQFGRGEHEKVRIYSLDLTPYGYDINVKNGTWAQTYDLLISTIKKCTDNEIRYKLMHLAEDMIMSTGCIIPLYYYTDVYMIDESIDGFFTTPLGYKCFTYCTVKG